MTIPLAPRRAPLVVLALACAMVACGASPGAGAPIGQVSSALFANDQTIYDYFVGKGLTNFQAAGIVGNLDQESGGDPTAVQGGGPGRGIAQWSVGGRWDTDANDNLTAFANAKGQPVLSLQIQLDFIWYELTTFPGFGLAALQATTNVTDATVVFQDKFEGCGTCDQTQRVSYAMDALAAYGASVGAGGSGSGGASGSSGVGGSATGLTYAAKYVSQSWPLSGAPAIQMQVGQTMKGSIDLMNTGSATWTAGAVLLAPIPRDQPSTFQSPSWPSATRVSSIPADVPPGQTGHFAWDLTPSQAGDFSPFFGLVADNVMIWFADSGGPPDNDIQVHVVVAPGAGVGAGGAGPGAGGSGPGGAAGSGPGAGGAKMGAGGIGTAGSPAAGPGGAGASPGAGGMSTGAGGVSPGAGGKAGGSAGGATKGGAAGAAAAGGAGGSAPGDGHAGAGGSSSDAPVIEDGGNTGSAGGCSASPSSPSSPRALLGAALAVAALARRRRRA